MSEKSEKKHDEHGFEKMDPTPMQPPLGFRRTPSLHEQIRHAVMIDRLENMKLEETEDEADDFEIGEDFEPLSPHENDHIPSIREMKKKVEELNLEIKKANTKAAIAAYEKKLAESKPETPAEVEETPPPK